MASRGRTRVTLSADSAPPHVIKNVCLPHRQHPKSRGQLTVQCWWDPVTHILRDPVLPCLFYYYFFCALKKKKNRKGKK